MPTTEEFTERSHSIVRWPHTSLWEWHQRSINGEAKYCWQNGATLQKMLRNGNKSCNLSCYASEKIPSTLSSDAQGQRAGCVWNATWNAVLRLLSLRILVPPDCKDCDELKIAQTLSLTPNTVANHENETTPLGAPACALVNTVLSCYVRWLRVRGFCCKFSFWTSMAITYTVSRLTKSEND